MRPPAGLERRFYAFVVDRLIAWALFAAGGVLAWTVCFRQGHALLGVLLLAAVVLAVSGAYAVLLGLAATSPGKALLGLRVVGADAGGPIGVPAAAARTAVLGVATLPTAGLGLATLAWTAAVDPGTRRRGLHDLWSGSVVLDARPTPVPQEAVDQPPRPEQVNLTALRLRPAPPEPVLRPAAPAAVVPAPAAAPPGSWRVTFDTGETFVVEGPALVGRRPEPRSDERVRHLVALASFDLSLSTTHAQFQVVPDGALVIRDRGSTHGSFVVRGGVTRPLTSRRPSTLLAGDDVRLGDRTMTVSKDAGP